MFIHEVLDTDVKWQHLKYEGDRFSKNLFFRPKMPEICRKNRFFGFLSRFHHLFFLIFCTKTRISNAQNMAESNFRENAGNILEIAVSFVRSFVPRSFVHMLVRRARSYFHYQVGPISIWLVSNFFAQRFILGMLKTWPSPIFEKKSFPAAKCRKCAGKTSFFALPRDLVIIFSDFLLKDAF